MRENETVGRGMRGSSAERLRGRRENGAAGGGHTRERGGQVALRENGAGAVGRTHAHPSRRSRHPQAQSPSYKNRAAASATALPFYAK